MKTLQPVSRFLICLSVMPLVSGCHLDITVGDSSLIDDNTSVLPDPPGDNPVPLDDAQEARRREAERYTLDIIYQGATIIQAIQLPSGDIIDGIDRNTLPALPYQLPPLPFAPEDLTLPAGVELGLADFEQYPELLDLVTVAAPFQRPDFSAYIMGETDATSIEDYLVRYDPGGAPSTKKRLYAGLRSHEPNLGVSGYMNAFHPKVESGTFSLMELAVFCPVDGEVQEMIGVVIQSSRVAGKNGQPRLRIEYARPNANNTGIDYAWDGKDGHFVPNPFRRYRPGQVVPVSVVGGKQVEHRIGIFQMPGTFDWWITYNDDVLGYYPGYLFTMLNGGACGTAWYVEVYNPDPANRGAIKTEAGSGKHGSVGAPYTAYVRNPKYYEPLYWLDLEPIDDPTNSMVPNEPDCYSRKKLENGIMYLGGDGGDNPYCVWP